MSVPAIADQTAERVRHAVYHRRPGKRRKWKLLALFDTAEEAWTAALDHREPGDVWLSTVPAGERSTPSPLPRRDP